MVVEDLTAELAVVLRNALPSHMTLVDIWAAKWVPEESRWVYVMEVDEHALCVKERVWVALHAWDQGKRCYFYTNTDKNKVLENARIC